MYTHFYGLSEEPFRDTPDPRFFFPVSGHPRALNCLKQGIEEKNGWILLTGEPGSGKTALIHQMVRSLKEKIGVKPAYIFQTRISFEDLLKAVLSELDLPPAPPAGVPIADHFIRSVSPVLPPGDTLVLFLDEAQGFSIEVLEKIHLFFGKAYPRPEQVQIILSGQAPLEEKLKSQDLRLLNQRIRLRCPINPLTAQESRRYVDHRLHLAGGNSDVFAPEALDLIIRRGEGIPRTLNIICDNSLRIGHQHSEPKISAAMVRKAFQEMYIQTDRRSAIPGPAKKKPLLRNIFYFLAAGFVLLMLFLFGGEYSPPEKGTRAAKKVETSAITRMEDVPPPAPKPEEKAPREKEAEPVPAAKEPVFEPPGQTALPAPASLEEPSAEPRVKKVITVKKGATLTGLCREHYGFANLTLLDHIMVLNPWLTNPNLILVDQRIKLPDIREEFLVQEKPGGKVQVFLGTFPYPDAARAFGDEPLLRGREIDITRVRLETGETWHRFSAGGFTGKKEALTAVRALKEKGLLPSFGGTSEKGG